MIYKAKEVPGAKGGGKQVLLQWRDRLARERKLRFEFKGVRHSVLIFVDKDVDDRIKVKSRKRGLTYSTSYCIENDLFEHGAHIADALAAASSMDPEVVSSVIDDRAWASSVRRRLADWTVLCLRNAQSPVSCGVGYGINPCVFNEDYLSLDAAKYAAKTTALANALQISTSHLMTELNVLAKDLDSLERKNIGGSAFKGKWYIEVLVADAVRHWPGLEAHKGRIKSGVMTSLARELDVSGEWFAQFRNAISDAWNYCSARPNPT